MSYRNKINPNKTIAIWCKTGGKCWYCGVDISGAMTIDHAHPVSQGGTDAMNNLVPCCKSCNSSKRNRTIDEFRKVIYFKKGMVFSSTQIRWLASKGIIIPEPDYHQFYFESLELKGE